MTLRWARSIPLAASGTTPPDFVTRLVLLRCGSVALVEVARGQHEQNILRPLPGAAGRLPAQDLAARDPLEPAARVPRHAPGILGLHVAIHRPGDFPSESVAVDDDA